MPGQNPESAMLIASLRDVIRKQSEEIELLRKQLIQASGTPNGNDEVGGTTFVSHAIINTLSFQLDALKSQVTSLTEELTHSEEKRKDVEREQEDLLVLLDEVNSKRKRDKARLRDAGLEVSEDEADEADEGDDE